MHTIHCVSFCQIGWILMIKSVDASAPKSVRINASCLERGYSEDSCTLQSLSHFLCYIFRILTNSGNWQSVTRIQYKQQQSLNFHKLALKLNSWKGNADAILENSMRILEVVRSEFWCDTGSGSLPFFWCSDWYDTQECQHLLVFTLKSGALMPLDQPEKFCLRDIDISQRRSPHLFDTLLLPDSH